MENILIYPVLFHLFTLSAIQCPGRRLTLLNVSVGITNARTVIACGLSIDIHPLFDPAQVIICPYVSIDQRKLQLIYLNVCK
jgi:hypothetical protein